MIPAFLAWGPAVTWAGVLFLLSELHGPPDVVWFALHDKLVHFGLYFVLGGALAWGRRKSPFPAPHAAVLLFGVAYGAVDEWHQSYVPGRIPSSADFLADIFGVVMGYVVVLAIWSVLDRSRPTPST